MDKPVLSTSRSSSGYILAPAPIGTMRAVLSVASVSYCVRVGRSDSGSGRPILWRLRNIGENEAK